MKKGLLLFALLLIAVGLIGPFVVGMQAEEVLHNQLREAVATSPGVEVESDGYSRGWFSSTSRGRLTVNNPEVQTWLRGMIDDGGAGPPVLSIQSLIHHGPLAVSPRGKLLPAIATAESTVTIQAGDEPLFTLPGKIYTTVGFSGDGTAHYVAESVQESFPDGEARWEGADLKLTFSDLSSRLDTTGSLGAFSIRTRQGELSGGPITVQMSQRRDPLGFWLGEANVGVDEFLVANHNDGLHYRFKRFSLRSDVQIDEAKLNYHVDLTADEIHGATLTDGSAALRLSLVRLDAAALANILAATDGGANLGANLLMVAGDLQTLLAGGPALELSELRLLTPDGEMYIDINLALPPASSPREIILGPALLYRLTGNATFRLPLAMVERAGSANPKVLRDVQRLVDSGFLKLDGSVYVMEAAYQGGLLTLNGAPVPLPLGGGSGGDVPQ